MMNSEARKRAQQVGPMEVSVSVVPNPAADPGTDEQAILLQLPADYSWIVTDQAGARKLAAALMEVADRVPQGEKSIDVQPCPECRVGKHINCDGGAWDYVADEHAPCPCSAASHKDES